MFERIHPPQHVDALAVAVAQRFARHADGEARGQRVVLAPGAKSRNKASALFVSIYVIDALIAEGLGASLVVWFAVVARRRGAGGAPTLAALIGQLPYRLRREAREIVALAREHDARHPNGSIESFTAREALRAYLPETLTAYLAVPPARRGQRGSAPRSPDEELARQLFTLRAGLEKLQVADADAGAARMAQNAAFLNERFGPAVPPPAATPASIVRDVVEVLSAYLRRA